ncbi:MAG: methionine synthase [Eubacterium sp.]
MTDINIEYIDREYTKRFLGYKGNDTDAHISEIMDECEEKILGVIRPKYIYNIFNVSDIIENSVSFEGIPLKLTGKSIVKHLTGCEKAMFLAATTSSGVDTLIRQAQVTGMTRAVIYDAMAGVAIEQICDLAELDAQDKYKEYDFTWRFGLGYGDLPIKLQKQFLDTLDAQKQIGLCSTRSCMLTPTKSVTCILGMKRKDN